MSEADLQNAAAYLQLTAEDFEARYVIRYKHLLRLRRPAQRDANCQFLTAEGCSIHAVKPTQCRTYPFWPSLVESQDNWKAEGKFCPGIGKGDLVQIKMARQIAGELPTAFPTLKDF